MRIYVCLDTSRDCLDREGACDDADFEAAAEEFAEQVYSSIRAEYDEAFVTVNETPGAGTSVHCTDDRWGSPETDVVEGSVKSIIREVYDAGEFWPAESNRVYTHARAE